MIGGLLFALGGLAVALLLPGAPSRWRILKPSDLASAGTVVPGQPAGIDDAPLMLELIAASLDAGLPLVRALEVLAGVSTERLRQGLMVVVAGLGMGASWQHSWQQVLHDPELVRLHDALSFSSVTGSASSPLLYAEAAQLRRSGQRKAEKRAAALGVKLVVPLGLCSLPAFICLGVAPVVLALAPSLR